MSNRNDQMKALANESRVEVLKILKDPKAHFGHQMSADVSEFGVCINLLAEKLGLAQPTVSRHVDILRRAGFLKIRRFQKWSYCSRDEAALREYHEWLSQDLAIEHDSCK